MGNVACHYILHDFFLHFLNSALGRQWTELTWILPQVHDVSQTSAASAMLVLIWLSSRSFYVLNVNFKIPNTLKNYILPLVPPWFVSYVLINSSTLLYIAKHKMLICGTAQPHYSGWQMQFHTATPLGEQGRGILADSGKWDIEKVFEKYLNARNCKSHKQAFKTMVPKSVTLNDFKRCNDRCVISPYAWGSIRQSKRPTPVLSATKNIAKN